MTPKIEIVARNMRLTDNLREYIEKKTDKLERHLQEIEEIRVEVSHVKARSATDRQVAQLTVHGRGYILRTEERADDIHAAFDTALDKMQRQIERYKGKHHPGRGDGAGAETVTPLPELEGAPAEASPAETVVRRKHFALTPMNELEAIEQMQLLGHEQFFVFYNAETNRVNVLYRRRDGDFGLIDPEIA